MKLKSISGNKKFKHYDLELGYHLFFCHSELLDDENGLEFIKTINSEQKFSDWKKFKYKHNELIAFCNIIKESVIYCGRIKVDDKDHIFFLHGDEDFMMYEMPAIGFFKWNVEYSDPILEIDLKNKKLSIFSDKYIWDEFKGDISGRHYDLETNKSVYELRYIKSGKYLKSQYPNSDIVGAVLVEKKI